MTSLAERCKGIWDNIRQSEAQMPSRVAIPDNHVDDGDKVQTALQPDEHYFLVRINEMYLTYSRKWFSEFDPMVFVVSEFTYDNKVVAVPFVVGPMMMKKYGPEIPTGMVFSDTRVAGLHPYRGGRLNLTVVLYRMKRDDYAKKLMQVVEGAANALDFSTALGTYVKVASVVLDGVEALLGLEGTVPLIGLYKEFDPDAGDMLKPSYFALIDMPDHSIKPEDLWVRNNQLHYGKNHNELRQFRNADYVLYSIGGTQERSDLRPLPFYSDWELVAKEATTPKESNWENAKANMAILYQKMCLSPDLTGNQAQSLADEYVSRMQMLHKNAMKISNLGGEKETEPSDLDSVRDKAISILKMK
jgi:hypothetical protein